MVTKHLHRVLMYFGLVLKKTDPKPQAPQYSLRSTQAVFEMVGFTRVHDKVHYKLKHQPSGKTFTVSKPLFEIFFERKG